MKISIVTPNFNGAKLLEETILSVIGQQYSDLEYIIIDGGSTDGSIEIIRKYEKHLSFWISEPDSGLYHALQKGFERSTGVVMGWINSDDKLHPGALSVVAEIFGSLPQVSWITGSPTRFDGQGRTVLLDQARQWSKYNFYLRDYKWIQQESTFWKRSLWDKAGSSLNLDIKYAADFELWLRFFRYEKVFTVRTILGGFRIHSSAQLSVQHREKYLAEIENLINSELNSLPVDVTRHLRKYRRTLDIIKALDKSRIFNSISLKRAVEKTFGDAPALIAFDPAIQKFRLSN